MKKKSGKKLMLVAKKITSIKLYLWHHFITSSAETLSLSLHHLIGRDPFLVTSWSPRQRPFPCPFIISLAETLSFCLTLRSLEIMCLAVMEMCQRAWGKTGSWRRLSAPWGWVHTFCSLAEVWLPLLTRGPATLDHRRGLRPIPPHMPL